MPDFGLKKIEVEGVSKLWIAGILLTVLKIIGLILLGLLILLLVIAALFLFMPLVYRFRVSYNDDKFELNGIMTLRRSFLHWLQVKKKAEMKKKI